VPDTLAAILRGEPDWQALPPDVPVSIRTLLRRCLEKDRRQRLADIADVRLEILEALSRPASDDPRDQVRASALTAMWPAAAAFVLGGLDVGSI
jgi:uncharacterized protein (DUF2267 family)